MTRLRALARLATVSLMGGCTYDFDQFEGLSPPVDDAGQDGHGGAGKDASAPDGSAGRAGSTTTTTGGAGKGGSGGATGGSGGAGGVSGSAGGAGASGGQGGSGGSGAAAGSAGEGGGSGNGGSAGSGGTSGKTPDASADTSGDTGGATGGTGGTGGATGGASGATGSGGAMAGSGGTAGGTGGATGGASGSSVADASDVNRPPDVQRDSPVVDMAVDAPFDCAAVNGTVYQGHCYYARSVAVDWNTANTTTCEAPAHLVTITSAGEQGIVAGLLSAQDRWIGLRRPTNSPQAESSFYWITNETLAYRNWDSYSDADKEPNYTGECVRMRFTSMWADVACTEALAVICERD
ncbi:MAG TPA: C-type lectin domain-containing protein [Polyangiaceae bacterium]|nr:C-type lectin domain-containing protein [Polyangiaceae bacterium]